MRRPNGHFTTPQRYFLERMIPVFLMIGTVSCGMTIKHGARASEPEITETRENSPKREKTAQFQPSPTPTPTSTPTPRVLTEKQIIIQKITEVFGEDAPDAFNILYCENRTLNPKATNHNRNGSIDRGLFQINSIHGHGDKMYDIDLNIKTAKRIFDQRGWSAWSCAERVGVQPFWK